MKKVDSNTLIEMIDPVIIVQFDGKRGRVLVPVDNFSYNFDGVEHPVPHLSLHGIWKQVIKMLGLREDTTAITIDVWEELDLWGTIYRYRGENYAWFKHGETGGYA
ncbi:hypothetical protein PPK15_gp40 [Bacillus phage 000TH010]|uniref:Uncharacterized protein n=1 Tax=Bacillus phage 000TH010 TaxID=2601652 RepID=A0A5P8PHS1_9CAUD|nr:hypothetical protein PPK15_gp40 [Bacillus phage 000TH010]QFR56253.1 hypothetical protein 000TH010_40 [Bacillus phage 000TH010]